MALTQSDWSAKSVGDRMVYQCTVSGTDEADLMTKKLKFDTTRPWSLIVTTSEDMTQSGTCAVDIWGGYSDKASLATADAGTDAVLIHANSTDLDAGATCVIHVFPGIDGTVTQVTNATPGFALIPPYPYIIVNLDLSAGLQDAAYITVTIVQ